MHEFGQFIVVDGEPLTLFARSSAEAVPIQIIASQANGPAGPFAVVQRFFDGNRTPSGVDPLVIGETKVLVSVFDNGNVEASWSLDDGSQGYLRSRGLSREAVVEIVAGLSPSPTSRTLMSTRGNSFSTTNSRSSDR